MIEFCIQAMVQWLNAVDSERIIRKITETSSIEFIFSRSASNCQQKIGLLQTPLKGTSLPALVALLELFQGKSFK